MDLKTRKAFDALAGLVAELDSRWTITLRRFGDRGDQWEAERRIDGRLFAILWDSDGQTWTLHGEEDGHYPVIAEAAALGLLIALLPPEATTPAKSGAAHDESAAVDIPLSAARRSAC